METNTLVVKYKRSEFNGAIKIRADEHAMRNIAALRLILTEPDAEPETYNITTSTVLVESLSGLKIGMADYTFTVGKKELLSTGGAKILATMERRGVHYMLTLSDLHKTSGCDFKLKRVEWLENNRPWIIQERFSTFTCDQLRKELERRSAEIRTHRPLNQNPEDPITELEWLEYDGRHLGK